MTPKHRIAGETSINKLLYKAILTLKVLRDTVLPFLSSVNQQMYQRDINKRPKKSLE